MIPLKLQDLISKVIAIGIVSLLVALWFHSYGVEQTAKLNTTAPADYIARKREIYHLSYIALYIGVCILGSIYILLVEAIAFLIRALLPKPNPFLTDDKPSA